MLLADALTELLLAKDYTPLSAQRRTEVLTEFLRWAEANGAPNVEDITRPLARRYVAHLRTRENARLPGKKLAGETQHSRASIVRMFLNFCVNEDWLAPEVVARFEMPQKGKKVLPVLSREQYLRLLRAAESGASARLVFRDKALLPLLLDTGVRAMEACHLTLDALVISIGSGKGGQESYIRVEGKGRAQREVGLGRQAALALHRYLVRYRADAPATERVFLNRALAPLTPNAIDRTLYRLRRVAGAKHFQGVRVSAHTFRHTFAVNFLQQGGELYKLSRLLGHENIATTERYMSAYMARDARLTSRSVLDGMA